MRMIHGKPLYASVAFFLSAYSAYSALAFQDSVIPFDGKPVDVPKRLRSSARRGPCGVGPFSVLRCACLAYRFPAAIAAPVVALTVKI
jgi:hypothetical protein